MKQSKHFGLFMFLYISTERRLLSVGNRHVSAIVDSCRSGPRKVRGGYSAYCTHSTGKISHSIISSPTRAPFNILCSLHVSLLQEPWLISLHSSHTSLLQDLQVIVSVITPTFLTCISTLIGKNQG